MARTPSDTENNIGKKPEALDPLSELSDFLYVCNTANQAHTHTRTTAEFAGRTVSKNMKILIKRSQEATFNKPVLETSGTATTYKTLRRLAGVQQGNSGDSLTKYMERFMCYTKTAKHRTPVPVKVPASHR
jgi:hypothetical protein